MTLREACNNGSKFLHNAGIENYTLDAAILLAKTLNTDRTQLMANTEKQLDEHHYENYLNLLHRRADHECTAYITNSKNFRFLELYVDKNVLVPRPDTETLVETTITRIDKLKKIKNEIHILDMCTGSGAVALSLKHERPFVNIYASDISDKALSVARKNAEKYQLQDIHLIQSDIFENITHKFDIITANAPYIPSGQLKTLQAEIQKEPVIALDGGEDGLEIIRRIINGARKHLLQDGHIFLEAAPEQMSEITHLYTTAGFSNINIEHDLSGADRVACAMT
ncbi:MAG: peptide chain release factor N(5)-glutamine methyltransferase [Spirochaetaceae bacterium]|jgi:release factor glutamine methyltransferase|nr:peptide chain release factor N(5)-glutamine methyltransferase [Spirochaetaceae bacterium]